jgi:RNA polymerase sigma-70 factor, ECF subfamily
MDKPDSDEDLMLRYRDGDARAFDVLYTRHKAPLFRYLTRQARPPAVVEELFQDIWTGVIKARAGYEVRAKFTTWLYRLAHNRLIDHYRRSATTPKIANDNDPEESLIDAIADADFREPENELERRRLGHRLLESIAALPDVQRETFLLREEGGLSIEEIADITGVNFETAKSRLRYALAKLRATLAPPQTGERSQP